MSCFSWIMMKVRLPMTKRPKSVTKRKRSFDELVDEFVKNHIIHITTG